MDGILQGTGKIGIINANAFGGETELNANALGGGTA